LIQSNEKEHVRQLTHWLERHDLITAITSYCSLNTS